jgi:transposase
MPKAASARRYTDEFKKDAVALLRSSGRPIREVAKQLGVSDTSLSAWADIGCSAGRSCSLSFIPVPDIRNFGGQKAAWLTLFPLTPSS